MKIQQIIVRVIIMFMLCSFFHIAGYQASAIADDQSEVKMPDKPLFRPEFPVAGEEFDDARAIMDEVIKNGNGKDDFLNDDKWETIEQKTAEGIEWAKQIDSRDGQDIFYRIYRGRQNDLQEAYENRANLHFLNSHIQKTLEEKEKRFYELLNTLPILKAMMKEYGLDDPMVEFVLTSYVDLYVKQTESGALLTNTAIAVLNIYDFLVKSDEYGEMRVLFEDLLELTELKAYISGLLKKYDNLVERLTTAVAQLDKALEAQGEVKHKPTSPIVSVFLDASDKDFYCPESYYVTGVYYKDSAGTADKSVKKLSCTRFDKHGYTVRTTDNSTNGKLEMNGKGTRWNYIPEGYAIVGAYYSNRDYSIEDFFYTKPVIYQKNKKCTIRFLYDYEIQMRGEGTQWYTCREGYFVTGAYYKDDREEPEHQEEDDSVEKIRCSYFEIECK